jgi:undecaprenyl-diphosphatase
MPAGFLVFSVLAWAFAILASEVFEGETQAFDRQLLLALRDPLDHADALGPPWLEEAAREVTSLGGFSVLTLITLMVSLFLWVSARPRLAALTIVATAGGAALSSVLKAGFDRPRPDLVPHMVNAFASSFPSGHAAASAVTYLTLGVLLASTQQRRTLRLYILSCALLLTVLVGVTRVYLGVHCPTDVIAGWCMGSAWAVLCGGLYAGLWSPEKRDAG